jgi:16S rRNA processing protein RimM
MSAAKKIKPGLPAASAPEFLVIGKVRRPHGVHGEMVAELHTDFPENIKPKKTLYVGEKHVEVVIVSLRQHNEGLLLGLEGITTPELAGRFRNQVLCIAAAEASKLAPGEYYFHELLDMDVMDEADKPLGTLVEILETGANDVYVVRTSTGAELLLPAIPEVILDVDLVAKKMHVHLLPGLNKDEPRSP